MFLSSPQSLMKVQIIKGGNAQFEIFPIVNNQVDFKNGVRCAIKVREVVILQKVIEKKESFDLQTLDANQPPMKVGFAMQNNTPTFGVMITNNNTTLTFITTDMVEVEALRQFLSMWPVGAMLADFDARKSYQNGKQQSQQTPQQNNNLFNQQGTNLFNNSPQQPEQQPPVQNSIQENPLQNQQTIQNNQPNSQQPNQIQSDQMQPQPNQQDQQVQPNISGFAQQIVNDITSILNQ